jgi:acrylyl-CoA reductase (NADPH)
MNERFPALLVTEGGGAPATLVQLGQGDLPEGDVTIEVEWSSMNYKDALAVTGEGRVVRTFPMVCGIDLAGIVISSTNDEVPVGSTVAVTGCGLGEAHFGGFSHYARVPGAWCVLLPDGLTTRRAMAFGTAGITAMLSFAALERVGSGPAELEGLPLLVTGATGGVGSLAVLIGARLGYDVTASTGRPAEAPYLEHLGATHILDRSELSDAPLRPLSHVRFGAAVDVVGGTTLANVLSSVRPFGSVAASGLVGGQELTTTVHPFILRGVTLAGVNAVALPSPQRQQIWERLATIVPGALLDEMTTEVPLSEVLALAPRMLAGQVRGRVVVSITP